MKVLPLTALTVMVLAAGAARGWADDAPACSRIADQGRLQVWRCAGSPGPECLPRVPADTTEGTQTWECAVAH